MIFVVGAVGAAYAVPTLFPKTNATALHITDCVFTSDEPLVFDKNQTVKLAVSGNSTGTFTIDGYEVSEPLEQNETKSITFKSNQSGVFDAKLSGCDEHAMIQVKNVDGVVPALEEHEHSDNKQHSEMESEDTHETEDVHMDSHGHDDHSEEASEDEAHQTE